MTKVAILPESVDGGVLQYRAIAGEWQSIGATAGQALDALTAQLPKNQIELVIVVQNLEPDEFFSAAQRARLESQMQSWRHARDQNLAFSPEAQAELDSLVAAELDASGKRAARLVKELNR
ncbi:hypothetical protein BH10PLA2_BH10PLA2_15270 [soil metagenome]